MEDKKLGFTALNDISNIEKELGFTALNDTSNIEKELYNIIEQYDNIIKNVENGIYEFLNPEDLKKVKEEREQYVKLIYTHMKSIFVPKPIKYNKI